MLAIRGSVLVCLLLTVAANTSTNSLEHQKNNSCPPWQLRRNVTGECMCSSYSLYSVVRCRNYPYELLLQECYCLTYNLQNELALGPCVYTCHRAGGSGYYFNATVCSNSLINAVMCGAHKRQCQMCGKCMPGYAPPVYSYSLTCVNCTTSNWGKYTAVSLLPLTAFFVFIVTFRISAFSPKLHGFILFSQILTCPCNMRSLDIKLPSFPPTQKHLVQACTSFFGIWNLDFFRSVYSPFCLHPHTHTLHVMALDYLIAVYPLLLIGLSYRLVLLYDHNVRPVVCLCKPFVTLFIRFRRQWNIRNSLVDAFATFFLLSYVKILSVSVDLLLPVAVYDHTGRRLHHLYVFNQGDVAYFSSQHLPYACLALFFLLTFTLLPMSLLFLYPCSCFQVCLNRTGCSCQSLHIFMDSFQGHHKNGTNGTRDCRFFSALYLLLRGMVYGSTVVAYVFFSYTYTAAFLVLFSVFLALARPYKAYIYFVNDVIFLALIHFLYVTIIQDSFSQSNITERAINVSSICFVLSVMIVVSVVNLKLYIPVQKCLSKCLKRNIEEKPLLFNYT